VTLLAALGVAIVVIAVATIVVGAVWPRKGKLGINLSKVFCPKCGQPMPMIRKPKNQRQALWGGWTCPKCGCEMDKYGVAVVDEAV
jgi:predicted RNA-binding Zn-ribbon protein involved in translation (DUF1610 family)